MTRLGFNILAVCGSAAFGGVMLSIGLSFGGIWQSLPPEDFSAWFAANNGHVSRPIPFVVLATLIGLAGSVSVAWKNRSLRRLWLASSACIVVVAILTFAYFVPCNTAFADGTIPAPDIPGRLAQWLSVHVGRISLSFAAAVLGMAAVTDANGLR